MKSLLHLAYLLFFIVFLIAIYYLTVYNCESFIKKNGEANEAGKTGGLININDDFNNNFNRLSEDAAGTGASNQTFNSFFDSFASGHLINTALSTLFRDDSAAAVYFPPDYSYEEAAIETANIYKSEFAKIYSNDFSKPLTLVDRRCFGENCLEQKGRKLSYRGKSLALPKGIKESEVAALSIGSLEKRWLIGVTLKKGVVYEGRVFYFDGAKFTPLLFPGNKEKITSSYIGLFGFGGEESDFLAVYGAYRGIAYRFQADKTTDLSQFFDFRIMAKGFRPEIIKASNGQATNWYIFSSSLGHPQLIKLWQNQSGEITGEAAYQDIFSEPGETVLFYPISASENDFKLLAKVKRGSGESWRVFTDRGFKNTNPGELVFNPIPVNSEIIIRKIANSELGSLSAPCPEGRFYFSADNVSWQELPRGENLNKDFKVAAKDNFYLRVDFPAQADRFYSPFLAEVLFDFYYQK